MNTVSKCEQIQTVIAVQGVTKALSIQHSPFDTLKPFSVEFIYIDIADKNVINCKTLLSNMQFNKEISFYSLHKQALFLLATPHWTFTTQISGYCKSRRLMYSYQGTITLWVSYLSSFYPDYYRPVHETLTSFQL